MMVEFDRDSAEPQDGDLDSQSPDKLSTGFCDVMKCTRFHSIHRQREPSPSFSSTLSKLLAINARSRTIPAGDDGYKC